MAVTADTDTNKSSFKSAAWMSQNSARTMVYDLWQSPLYVREQQTKYLEKFKKESPDKYTERLNRSVPRNKFRETIETMAGMTFKDDPAPTEIPTALSDLFPDIDACGNSLHSFLLTSFEKYMRDGGGAIWVDATPLSETAREKAASGQTLTAADRRGDRPFWVFVEARQMINHRYDERTDVLSQVTIERDEIESDGEFGEKKVKRHYILRPGSFEVRRYDDKTREFVEEVPQTPTGLKDIPLAVLAPFDAPPPLLELAMLNILHYNQLSDFGQWCHIACVPRQVIQLDDESDSKEYQKLSDSADVGLIGWGQHFKAYYLEVTGNGLEIAKKNIEDTAAEMAALGVGILAPSEVAPKSATEVLDTAGQRQSKLARFAREFENGVEKALFFTAEYLKLMGASVDLNESENVSLKLKMDFDRLTFDPERMRIFKELLAEGNLSRLTFFEILQKMLDMPDGWEPAMELKRLTEEESTVSPIVNARLLPNETTQITEVATATA